MREWRMPENLLARSIKRANEFVQAEAIRDLIDAQSVAAARQSVRQLRGELSNELQPLKDDLLDIIVVLESTLEFVEDDLPDFQTEIIKEKLSTILPIELVKSLLLFKPENYCAKA